MANMSLTGYTFPSLPSGMTIIQKDREVAIKKTYSSVVLFTWGLSYVGKIIELTWNVLSSSQYVAFQALYAADTQIVFDPQDGSSKTFNVEIVSLDGEYYIHLNDASGHYRRNVKMQLLIMSEAS